jgi:hypothetical protein
MQSASDRTVPLDLWPGTCGVVTVDAERLTCTLSSGHTGAHFDAAASRHFLTPGDAERIAREQSRRAR